MLRRILLVLVGLCLVACESETPRIKIHESISYCKGGEQTLLLDLIEPADRSVKHPAIIFVHGGGWAAGSRHDFRSLMLGVVPKGFVAVSVDYRLSQTAKFPAQIEDVKCAVRWLRAHADEYGVNPHKIAAVGGSAGAHLVALLGTTSNGTTNNSDTINTLTAARPEFEGQGGYAEQSSQIQAMVLHGGVYDLSPAFVEKSIHAGSRNNVFALLGARAQDNPQLYASASPIHWVTSTAVPSLILHGEEDPIVSVEQSRLMDTKLKAVGAKSELLVIPESGHMDFGKDPDKVGQVFFGFLHKHLME